MIPRFLYLAMDARGDAYEHFALLLPFPDNKGRQAAATSGKGETEIGPDVSGLEPRAGNERQRPVKGC